MNPEDAYQEWTDDWDGDDDAKPAVQPGSVALTQAAAAGGNNVQLPSGVPFPVLTGAEAAFLTDLVAKYLSQNAMQNVADLSDLDQVVRNEFFLHRIGIWLSLGVDYNRVPIDEKTLRDQAQKISTENRQLKKALNLDRVAREKANSIDSVPVYLGNVLRRAKEFGVHREKMADIALEKSMELIGKVTLYFNCDDDAERLELKVTHDQILEWIRDEFAGALIECDDYFRENEQKFWVRDI